MEGELLEERQRKEIKFDRTIETFKFNMQGDYYDCKLKFEERVMLEKEVNHKLKLEIETLKEKNLRSGL